jgi:hypothetical protein
MVRLDASESNEDEHIIEVEFNGEEPDFERQELDLVQRAGQYFNNITLKFVQDFHFFSLLEHIAKYCVHLETLTIICGPHFTEDLEYKELTPNYTVANLELDSFALSSKLTSFISNVFPC